MLYCSHNVIPKPHTAFSQCLITVSVISNLQEVGSLTRDAVCSMQLKQMCQDCHYTRITCQHNKLTECCQNIDFSVPLQKKHSTDFRATLATTFNINFTVARNNVQQAMLTAQRYHGIMVTTMVTSNWSWVQLLSLIHI